jgi:hypothetical protein
VQGTANGATVDAAVASYVVKDMTAKAVEFAMAPHVNPNDAQTSAVLFEISDMQHNCAKLYGAPYLQALGQALVAKGITVELATVTSCIVPYSEGKEHFFFCRFTSGFVFACALPVGRNM